MATNTSLPVDAALASVGGGENTAPVDAASVTAAFGRAVAGSRGVRRTLNNLGIETVRIATGSSTLAPTKGDSRFTDATWADNPAYRRAMQIYLALSAAVDELVEGADVDWRTKERARFAAGVLTSTLAPTNALVGNPAAMKRAFETGGLSLARGVRHLVGDLVNNGAMPRQVQASGFQVGVNTAATPGAVVFRNEVMEVLQYAPSTATVRARPVLIVPPQINKYYFLDLAPGRSLVEFLVSRGLQVFMISWRNPRKEHAAWDLNTYAREVLGAIDLARDISGSDEVLTLGLCAGGITTSAALSYLCGTGQRKVHAAAFGVTLLDWSVPAAVGAFQSGGLLRLARSKSRRAGVLDARSLGTVFTWMRPNDLVWNYWVNNYLLGNKPPAFDILAWNADSTNLPSALHHTFLDIFENNLLVKSGARRVLGKGVDLSAIKIDTYVVGGLSDHLTPWQGCYRGTQLFGGESTFVLSPTGHIQTPVSPPSPKAYHFTGPAPGPDPEAWRSAATRHEGTWWANLADWLSERAGSERPSCNELGNAAFPELCPAPGTYIRHRA